MQRSVTVPRDLNGTVNLPWDPSSTVRYPGSAPRIVKCPGTVRALVPVSGTQFNTTVACERNVTGSVNVDCSGKSTAPMVRRCTCKVPSDPTVTRTLSRERRGSGRICSERNGNGNGFSVPNDFGTEPKDCTGIDNELRDRDDTSNLPSERTGCVSVVGKATAPLRSPGTVTEPFMCQRIATTTVPLPVTSNKHRGRTQLIGTSTVSRDSTVTVPFPGNAAVPVPCPEQATLPVPGPWNAAPHVPYTGNVPVPLLEPRITEASVTCPGIGPLTVP